LSPKILRFSFKVYVVEEFYTLTTHVINATKDVLLTLLDTEFINCNKNVNITCVMQANIVIHLSFIQYQ
jgi:hypothetical protein